MPQIGMEAAVLAEVIHFCLAEVLRIVVYGISLALQVDFVSGAPLF